MDQFLATETLIIELLLVVSLVAIAVRRLKVPYTEALVIVGLLISSQQSIEIDVTPELILALFVPPLVFEAAFHIEFNRLRDNLVPILLLEDARREGLRTQRATLAALQRDGVISERAYEELVSEVDAALGERDKPRG